MGNVAIRIGILAASLCAHAAHAEPGLHLSATERVRVEAIGGQARAGFNRRDELLNFRTTIGATYEAGPLKLVAELWDSRVYGGNPRSPVSTSEVNAFELVQAYAELKLAKGAKLQAGRFLLNLGSRRLVAADDYRNTTNGYTGLKVDIEGKAGLKATVIYTLPQMRLPDDPESVRDHAVRLDRESFDLVLWGGILSKDRAVGSAMAELSYFHLGERDAPGRPTRDRSLDTFGGRVITQPVVGKLDYEVEAFYQTGHVSASLASPAPQLPVSAGFVHADLGYSFAGRWKPHLSAEFDWASGDRAGGHYGRFDTLFGMRRADLAPAGLYNALARTNILTPGVRMEVSPGKRLDMFVAGRLMWLAAREDSFSSTGVRDASGASGRFAGRQVEGRLRYWIIPARLRFEYDGLVLDKGRFLRDAPNAPAKHATFYNSFNLTISI
jgi:hypothetical protein